MQETALSPKDAMAAGIRFRLVEDGGGVCVEEGEEGDHRFDVEQVLHLVRLALESGRAVRIGLLS